MSSTESNYHGRRRSVILDYLDNHPRSTSHEISEALGIEHKNISSRLSQLEKAGSVQRERAPDGVDHRTKFSWSINTDGKKSSGPTGAIRSRAAGAPKDSLQGSSREHLQELYIQKLLARLDEPNPPAWVFERLERLISVD